MAKIESKRLVHRHRLMMANLAVKTFTMPALREAEQKAKAAFFKAVGAAAKAIPKKEMEVFKAWGLVTTVEQIDIPHLLSVKIQDRKIELPSGETVDRASTYTYNRSSDEELFFADWTETIAIRNGKLGDLTDTGTYYRTCNLDEPLLVPGLYSQPFHSRSTVKVETSGELQGAYGKWFKPAQPALTAWFKAMEERIQAEAKLLCAAFKVLGASQTYGDVLAVWPEVRSLENDLFGDQALTTTALVTLNDEDRALLCNHMGNRGVTSALCAAGTSPAYGLAAE